MAITVFDARAGLSAAVLDDLWRANRVLIQLKDRRVAALGYWIATPGGGEPAPTEELRIVILPAQASLTPRYELSQEQPLTIANAQNDVLWQRALEHLHPGDVATVHWAIGWAAVSLSVARRASGRAAAWGVREYQQWTVPLSKQHLWPGLHLSPNFVPTYFLGHTTTTTTQRWRTGQRRWTPPP